MAMTPSTDRMSPKSVTQGVQKHRACDECRARKLACSKEPDGCKRCRREGIKCHYSAQKPMGRPRKRRHVEDAEPTISGVSRKSASKSPSPPVLKSPESSRNASLSSAFAVTGHDGHYASSSTPQSPPNHNDLSGGPFPSTSSHSSLFGGYDASLMPLDPSLDLLGTGHSDGVDFMGMLPNFADQASALPHDLDPDLHNGPHNHVAAHDHGQHGALDFDFGNVDLTGGIGFGHVPSSMPRGAPASRVLHNSFESYVESSSASPSVRSVPTTSESTNPSGPGIRPNPTVTCSCLSGLYLSLDSLNNLPDNIFAAIRTARHVAKVAHDSVICEICCNPAMLNDPDIPVPVQAHQNMMLLAALVPAACNAYAAILQRVDNEAERAQQAGEPLFFSFNDVGGPWRKQAEEDGECLLLQNYNNKTMPSNMWRAVMRNVIRVDIDGLPDSKEQEHMSLRDVITALEKRSDQRHAILDVAQASGQLKDNGFILHPSGLDQPKNREDRHCMRLFDHARLALDKLSISN